MNEYYERIRALFITAGINVPDYSYNDGEAYAYGAALAAVAALPTRAAARTGMDGAEAFDAAGFAALLGVDATRLDDDALKEEIRRRLSHSYADYTAEDVAHAFALVGSGTMSEDFGMLTFAGVKPEDLTELGKFITAFQYCGVPVAYAGSGMTFDEWDAMDYQFEQYDHLQLPWDILDDYRRTV